MTSRRNWLVLLLAGALTGCYVEVSEDWDDDERDQLCAEYCVDLTTCGAITWDDYDRCERRCEEAYDDDPRATRDACGCVQAAGCSSSLQVVWQCGAPPPSGGGSGGQSNSGGSPSGTSSGGSSAGGAPTVGGNATTGGSAGGGSTSGGGTPMVGGAGGVPTSGGGTPTVGGAGAGGGSPGSACNVPHDCAPGEDCVARQCQQRCYASCECPEGKACVEGYCAVPKTPTPTCADDCDCPRGQHCVSGHCG